MATVLSKLICCTYSIKMPILNTEIDLFPVRYHFSKNCLVINWSGDNPNSVAGAYISSFSKFASVFSQSCIFFHLNVEMFGSACNV